MRFIQRYTAAALWCIGFPILLISVFLMLLAETLDDDMVDRLENLFRRGI